MVNGKKSESLTVPQATRRLSKKETERMEDLLRFLDANLTDIFKTDVDFHLNFIINEKVPGGAPAFTCSNIQSPQRAIYMLENAIKAAQQHMRGEVADVTYVNDTSMEA